MDGFKPPAARPGPTRVIIGYPIPGKAKADSWLSSRWPTREGPLRFHGDMVARVSKIDGFWRLAPCFLLLFILPRRNFRLIWNYQR